MEQLWCVCEWQKGARLTTSTVLEQLGAKQREQIRNYRKYVESSTDGNVSEEPLPTIKQMVIGDEEFAEQVLRKRRPAIAIERSYTLTDVEEAVCQITQIDREDLARAQRTPVVNRARELFMYLARRHTDASLREVAQRLWVRDISTVSHGEKRITISLQENSPTAKEVKRILNHSSLTLILGLAISQLGKGHAKILIETRKGFDFVGTAVTGHATAKRRQRQKCFVT